MLNRRTFSFPEREDVLKFENLEACKVKKAAFGWQGSLKNHQNSKFQVQERSSLWRYDKKKSVPSDKNVPLIN